MSPLVMLVAAPRVKSMRHLQGSHSADPAVEQPACSQPRPVWEPHVPFVSCARATRHTSSIALLHQGRCSLDARTFETKRATPEKVPKMGRSGARFDINCWLNARWSTKRIPYMFLIAPPTPCFPLTRSMYSQSSVETLNLRFPFIPVGSEWPCPRTTLPETTREAPREH